MYKDDNGKLVYSASDLMVYMESPFGSWMNRLEKEGLVDSIDKDPVDSMMGLLARKGLAHEQAYLEYLKADGKDVCEIDDSLERAEQERATIKAMHSGAEVIFQARLVLGDFAGYADFLIKVPGSSKLGDYHYTVWDTKLARKAKPYFTVQLCCYAEMLQAIQGCLPEVVAVVLGKTTDDGGPEIQTLRTRDYYYFFRFLKRRFLADQQAFDHKLMPDPANSASWGSWSGYANTILHERDDLCFVANITRTQIQRLQQAGIHSLTALATSEVGHIPKMNSSAYRRLKAQAAIQLASTGKDVPLFEVVINSTRPNEGLALLPPPSDQDVYFDLEGFPLMEDGLEYLWGVSYEDGDNAMFTDWWAHDREGERVAFEGFIDWVYARWLQDPAMHIYHYGHYEVAVLRRLMGRFGSREHKVDQLLRNNVLIDLYPIVRKGLLVGEPAYSIKNIEHIYRGSRDTDVASGLESVVVYENWRENPDGMCWQSSEVLASIREYNKDDCDSTLELVQWLRGLQQSNSIDYLGPAPANEEAQAGPKPTDISRLADRLLTEAEEQPEASITETLGWSLEFHRREAKPGWWKLFDWMGCTFEELYDDMECLAGLRRTASEPWKTGPRKRKQCFEYSFDPDQDTKLSPGGNSTVYVIGEDHFKVTLLEVDCQSGIAVLESMVEPSPVISVCPDNYVNPEPIPSAILEFVERWFAGDIEQNAVVDFLERRRPNLISSDDGPLISGDIDIVDGAIATVLALDNSTLCIQGPPGTGKTHTASHMIGALIAKGYRVGVMSNSHKAVLNLISKAVEVLDNKSIPGDVTKVGGGQDPLFDNGRVSHIGSMRDISLTDDNLLVGATAWGFAHESVRGEFDYLFVDEAGQVSIANLIGAGRCTRNIVLMGDQMQLSQPIQCSHPGQSGKSCLEYLLGEHPTIPDDMGIFLPVTWRMHPDICQVLSEMVYEGRLVSHESTTQRMLMENADQGRVAKNAGIQFVSVEHKGNNQYSEEEVAVIGELVDELLNKRLWTKEGIRPVTIDDILFVAPFNAQVRKLQEALPDAAKIGSVDKFQGQEAPIVVISMCASNAGDSLRGIDFIFNRNRLNVALSRAETLALVVGSPELANTPVNNLEQMTKVNSFCWLLEKGCVSF